MKTVFEHIRTHLLESAGMVERVSVPDLDDLRKTEWVPEFEQLMRNRLLMGAFRYGLLNTLGKLEYDHIGSIEKRLAKFRVDHNLEHLVDVANLCMVEFYAGTKRGQTVQAQDDGEHCEPA